MRSKDMVRLGALALCALLAPLPALSQADGAWGSRPVKPGVAAPAQAKPAAASVKAAKKARGRNAAKASAIPKPKDAGPQTYAERRAMRGTRLRENGEAMGGGQDRRLAQEAEDRKAQESRGKK